MNQHGPGNYSIYTKCLDRCLFDCINDVIYLRVHMQMAKPRGARFCAKALQLREELGLL